VSEVLCSLDLRERVVNLVRNEGKTRLEAAERFQVSISSVKRWLKLEHLAPKKPGPTKSRTIQAEQLKELVEQHPDAYLDEYAKMLNSNKSTVSYNLLKLGISRKKNYVVRRAKRRKTQNIPTGTCIVESC
jgi:transposase